MIYPRKISFMAKRKSIADILWNVDEKTYREDSSYHYSMLSDFRMKGFHCAGEILERTDQKKSPSLVFGSLLDAMLTDPEKLSEFENIGSADSRVKLTATEKKVADFILQDITPDRFECLMQDSDLLYDAFLRCEAYMSNSKRTVLDKHGLLVLKYVQDEMRSAADKMQITEEDYVDALECKEAILNSKLRQYFVSDPFEDDIERVFQAKLKIIDRETGIQYRVMLDNITVNHTKKTIQPNDLKTTSGHEDEFYRSFIKWNYDIQARLYWRALYNAIKDDPYFKEFTVLPFQFLVISRYSKTPMIWSYDDCVKTGELCYIRRNNMRIIFEDPFALGALLKKCEERPCLTKPGTSTISVNSLDYWIESGD